MFFDSNITIKDMIQLFLEKYYSNLDNKIYSFISGSKIINSPKFLNKCLNRIIYESEVNEKRL